MEFSQKFTWAWPVQVIAVILQIFGPLKFW